VSGFLKPGVGGGNVAGATAVGSAAEILRSVTRSGGGYAARRAAGHPARANRSESCQGRSKSGPVAPVEKWTTRRGVGGSSTSLAQRVEIAEDSLGVDETRRGSRPLCVRSLVKGTSSPGAYPDDLFGPVASFVRSARSRRRSRGGRLKSAGTRRVCAFARRRGGAEKKGRAGFGGRPSQRRT
jgi:hypothetical protein